MRNHWCGILLLLGCVVHCSAQHDASDFYVFNDCSATSTEGPEFVAQRAIQPGTGYWSSAGGLPDDEQVTWTGYLATPGKIKGLRVRWQYAPGEVQVAISSNGVDYHVALPWRPAGSSEAAYDEDILFGHDEEAKVVVIGMRKQIHGFYGINEAKPLGSGEPLMMIIGGITSPAGEMCLQVEAGKFSSEGSSVVIDSCTSALAAGDGRELWYSTPQMQLVSARSTPPKCMTLQDGSTEDGGNIVLTDCLRALEEGDGRSSWTFEGNSQLRLQRAGAWCMTQKDVNGSSPGVGDLIRSGEATASSSSSSDAAHGANAAIDKDSDSSWRSDPVGEAEQTVVLTVNLGKASNVVSVRIQWEYPALSYEIYTSPDGNSYVQQAVNPANPVVDTLDELHAGAAQFIQIRMLKPHPRLGKADDSFFYGIYEVHVYANRLGSAVSPCTQAANSDDARDKYFVEYVTSFNPVLADKITSMEEDVLLRQKGLNTKAKDLEALLPEMEGCRNDKIQFVERMKRASRRAGKIFGQFQSATGADMHRHNARINNELASGDSPAKPADDCYSIKTRESSAVSGFYWIMPQCSPAPLRVYCDMTTGTSIYVWNGHPPRKPGVTLDDVVSLNDVRNACARVGLEPMVPKSPQHFQSILSALHQMGFNLNGKGAVPLAFDYSCLYGACTGEYRDLSDGATDLTSLVLSQSAPDSSPVKMDAAGLGLNGERTSFFDLSSAPLVAVICSTNTIEGEGSAPDIDIDCDTTAEGHEAFEGIINTNVVVECPADCADDTSLPVYGSDGVYSASSSICRAAIHAGLIKTGGVVNVSIESPRASYEGSVQNGIVSSALEISPDSRALGSIRLSTIFKDCPVVAHEEEPPHHAATSFLETATEAGGSTMQFNADITLDADIQEALQQTIHMIDLMHNVDPEIFAEAKEEAGIVVGASRKQLKPAEKLHHAQSAQVLEIFVGTESLAARWLAEAGNMFQTLDQLNQKLRIAEQRHLEQTGFESFKLYPQSMAFKDYFETFDSMRAKHGPSNWGYASAPIQGRRASIGQSRNIVGTSETEGTYAMLRGRRFYDAEIQVSFYAVGSGSVGIAFKIRDFNNMYLLWMNQKQAVKRLLRIEDGQPTIVAERKDGGYIQGKWFNVRIETNKGVIRVCIGEEGSAVIEVFSVLDERFMVGSVGFFSSGMEAGVFFEGLNIDAKDCTTPSKAIAPAPPRCSTFAETFYGNPNSIYRKIDASDAAGAEGSWVYKANVGGRNKVLAQVNAVRGPSEIGTSAVIKGNRTCKNGYFVFEFFPQCTGGIVGGIFRFTSPQEYQVAELAPYELRIRAISNGHPKTVARTPVSMSLNEWHRMEINFEGSTVSVRLEGPGGGVKNLSADDLFGGQTRDGMVGFSAYNCGGVAFDSIQLSPYKMESIAPTESIFTVISATKAWQPCLTNVHILHRRDECQRMFVKEPSFRQIACAQDFCSECCNYNTSLLPRSEWAQCEKKCRRNDPLASLLASGMITRLSTCLKELGDAAAHCKKGNMACQKEACELCCISWSPAGSLDQIGADLQDATEREQEECKFQCAKHFVPRENLEL
ncbi:F5/8 type C domain-containing protein [Toxoplasma gondii p89]|uniref:F5/8 type C domain-containing protein n=1 Tax=Toxoplasma gondii p89 TaxID=943119 RepID=A0A086JGM1_TOXGO|nr:F5/8 type C domain-containing protein [Toxoplasma gondii p89]